MEFGFKETKKLIQENESIKKILWAREKYDNIDSEFVDRFYYEDMKEVLNKGFDELRSKLTKYHDLNERPLVKEEENAYENPSSYAEEYEYQDNERRNWNRTDESSSVETLAQSCRILSEEHPWIQKALGLYNEIAKAHSHEMIIKTCDESCGMCNIKRKIDSEVNEILGFSALGRKSTEEYTYA